MGEKMLPHPTRIELDIGRVQETVKLIFKCNKTGFEKEYRTSKGGIWLKHLYVLGQIGQAGVQVAIGEVFDAAFTIAGVVQELCSDNHKTYEDIFSTPCLKSEEHDALLESLTEQLFYE